MKRKPARKSNQTPPVLDKLMLRALREQRGDFVGYVVDPTKRMVKPPSQETKPYDEQQVRTLLQRANDAVRHNLTIIEKQQRIINNLLFSMPHEQVVALALDALMMKDKGEADGS